MPERGFVYFSSPDKGDDQEIIAYLFLYCNEAVRLWPEFRRKLERSGEKPREQCDHIEAYAIEIFREVRDTILAAIESDDMRLLSEPRLGQRYAHAAAMMALYADTPSLVEYRRMICPGIDDLPDYRRPTQGDFEKALWEKQWSNSGEPGEVTYREALRNRRVSENDGRYNTRQRLDRAATGEVLGDCPEERPAPLSEKQIAQFRRELRALGTRAGLKKGQLDFLVGMALEGKQQKDNPTAWRAIRGRKRVLLLGGVQALLIRIRAQAENDFYPGISDLQEMLS